MRNFNADWNYDSKYKWRGHGSLAYSWDYNSVHFVQLQFHPIYKVNIDSWDNTAKQNITSSLNWLREDLRQARLRGVRDIVLNAHIFWKDFKEKNVNASENEKKMLQAILETYKPIVVFQGHLHTPIVDLAMADFPVESPRLTTGAAFDAKYDVAEYNNEGLKISRMDGNQFPPKKTQEIILRRPTQAPICKVKGERGKSGDIYVDQALLDDWVVFKNVATGTALETDKKGRLKVANKDSSANSFQSWYLKKVNPEVPYFSSAYQIVNKYTQRALDSDFNNQLYTNPIGMNNRHQQWVPIKVENGQIMWKNLATGFFLESAAGKLYTIPGYDIFNKHKAWVLEDAFNRTSTSPNSQYYKAKRMDSYLNSFPTSPGESDYYWEHMGNHSYLNKSPCIGW